MNVFFRSCVYLKQTMRPIYILTTLIALTFTYTVNAQQNLTSEKQQLKRLIKQSNVYVNQFKYDSAIYYVDKRIQFDIKKKNEIDLISAYSRKIELLRLQQKHEQAYRIALNIY